MASREAKAALFDAFGRVGKAMSSGRRVEILDVLANGERSVEALADELELTLANASHHLQTLLRTGFVTARREGNYVFYRLAAPEVFEFLRSLRALAAARVADVDRLAEKYLGRRDELEPLTREELARRMRDGDDLLVLDVRPSEEYRAGHVPGAVSIPVTELQHRLREIPKGVEIVAYCRGPYCAFAHEAVAELRRKGYEARRLEEGLPEWAAAGLPVSTDGLRK